LNGQTFCLLLAATTAVSLFFIALTKQLVEPPPTTMGCETMTVSFNAHPKQIFDELDRALQRDWVEKIPNRRYTKVSSEISGSSGEFGGESLEETQPMPIDDLRQIDLRASFSEPRYRWLVWLNLLGLVLVIIATLAFIVFGTSLKPASIDKDVFRCASIGVVMLLVGHFCFKAGHLLWGRFDFRSEVVWVEMRGNYQSAKFDYGNQFFDRIKTQKQVINIETMTLRVWVAQLDTVAFGKGAPRWLVGMNGLPDKAKYLAQHLVQFAANQSVIVAPTAQTDMQRVAALGALNQLGGGAFPADIARDANDTLARLQVGANGDVQGSTANDCSSCGVRLGQGSLFCTNCGAKCAVEA
jgi:hypothetical protein